MVVELLYLTLDMMGVLMGVLFLIYLPRFSCIVGLRS
jgi:hypothetical protein